MSIGANCPIPRLRLPAIDAAQLGRQAGDRAVLCPVLLHPAVKIAFPSCNVPPPPCPMSNDHPPGQRNLLGDPSVEVLFWTEYKPLSNGRPLGRRKTWSELCAHKCAPPPPGGARGPEGTGSRLLGIGKGAVWKFIFPLPTPPPQTMSSSHLGRVFGISQPVIIGSWQDTS